MFCSFGEYKFFASLAKLILQYFILLDTMEMGLFISFLEC